MPDGKRDVSARVADGDERARLWAEWAELDGDLDAYAAGLSHETPVVILESRRAPTQQRQQTS